MKKLLFAALFLASATALAGQPECTNYRVLLDKTVNGKPLPTSVLNYCDEHKAREDLERLNSAPIVRHRVARMVIRQVAVPLFD